MTVNDAKRILEELGYEKYEPAIVSHDDFYATMKEDGKLVAEMNIFVHFSIRETVYNERKYHNEEVEG